MKIQFIFIKWNMLKKTKSKFDIGTQTSSIKKIFQEEQGIFL